MDRKLPHAPNPHPLPQTLHPKKVEVEPHSGGISCKGQAVPKGVMACSGESTIAGLARSQYRTPTLPSLCLMACFAMATGLTNHGYHGIHHPSRVKRRVKQVQQVTGL